MREQKKTFQPASNIETKAISIPVTEQRLWELVFPKGLQGWSPGGTMTNPGGQPWPTPNSDPAARDQSYSRVRLFCPLLVSPCIPHKSCPPEIDPPVWKPWKTTLGSDLSQGLEKRSNTGGSWVPLKITSSLLLQNSAEVGRKLDPKSPH